MNGSRRMPTSTHSKSKPNTEVIHCFDSALDSLLRAEHHLAGNYPVVINDIVKIKERVKRVRDKIIELSQ